MVQNTFIPGTTLQDPAGFTLETFLGVQLQRTNPMLLALSDFANANRKYVTFDQENGCVMFGLDDVTFIIAADRDFDLKPCLRVTIRTYCPTANLFESALQYSIDDALKQLKVGIDKTMNRPTKVKSIKAK